MTFGMVLVDHVGPIQGAFPMISSVPWNGVTFACIILPGFQFIMGIAIPMSIKHNRPITIKNFTRIIGLFLIGVVMVYFHR